MTKGDKKILVNIHIYISLHKIVKIDAKVWQSLLKGGLTAVIWTDFIQTILMLIGAIILAALGTPIQYIYIIKLFAHLCTYICTHVYIFIYQL